jgi:hypothetical protein
MSSHTPAIARLVSGPTRSISEPPGDPLASPSSPSDYAGLDPPEAEQRWSRVKQAAFLRHLAALHSVAAAARSVGMSRQSAYRLRARLKGQPFDRAWGAFDCVFNALAHAAMERALYGVAVPYLHNGEVVHVARKFDERLTLGLLKMRYELLPEFAEPLSDAAAYERDDFPGLLGRVERGPEEWGDA